MILLVVYLIVNSCLVIVNNYIPQNLRVLASSEHLICLLIQNIAVILLAIIVHCVSGVHICTGFVTKLLNMRNLQ